MQFKDGNIEKTIVFDEINIYGGDATARFRIEINGIFQINVFSKTIFTDENDVFFETNTDGYKNIISKQPEVMEWMKKTHLGELEKLRNEKIESWYYSGFGSNFSISPNGKWNLRNISENIRKIVDTIKDHHVYNHGELLNKMDEKSESVEVCPDRFQKKISNDDLMKLYNEIVERIERKEQEKQEKENAKKEAIFKKAKETGEPQLLVRWTEKCNDPREECNTDLCSEWAMPNGTTKYERTHSW